MATSMRSSLLVLSALLSLTLPCSRVLAWQTPRPLPKLSIERGAGGKVIVRALVPGMAVTELPRRAVPYTAEPYNLTVMVRQPEVRETNIFGSGLALDLDGDGKTTGVLKVACDPSGGAQAGPLRLRPVGMLPFRYPLRKGGLTGGQLGKRGVSALLYRPCHAQRPVTFGLTRPGQPLKLLSVPGPALQLLIFESVRGPRSRGALKLLAVRKNGRRDARAKRHQTYDYEPLFGSAASWAAVTFVFVTLDAKTKGDQTVELSLSGAKAATDLMVVSFINWSTKKRERLRHGPAMRRSNGQR